MAPGGAPRCAPARAIASAIRRASSGLRNSNSRVGHGPPQWRAVLMVGRGVRAGFRIGIPYAVAAFLLAISFGVLAEPVMGTVAPIVMSAVLFAGSAQFAATAVLAAGGGAAAAIAAGA